MELQENTVIGELVAQDYRAASVFKKYSIDFCCQGNKTISDACEKKHIATDSVLNDLTAALQSKENGATDYQNWPLDLLADYIEKRHHRYVEEKTQEIKPYLDKITRVHGGRHPELEEINQLFNDSAGELAMHMKKEELMLFPYVRKIGKAHHENTTVTPPAFGTIQNPVQMMMSEHLTEGDRFRRIAELSDDYTPPADACNTFRVTYALLKEFEADLHLHIHLENNILFPRAVEMEKSVLPKE